MRKTFSSLTSVDWTSLPSCCSHLCFNQFIPAREGGVVSKCDLCLQFSFEQHKILIGGSEALGGSFLLFSWAGAGVLIRHNASWSAHRRAQGEVEVLRGWDLGYPGSLLMVRAMCFRRAPWPTALSKPCCALPGPAPSLPPPRSGAWSGEGDRRRLWNSLADQHCDPQTLSIFFSRALLQLNCKEFYFIRDVTLFISSNPFFIENTKVEFDTVSSQTAKHSMMVCVSLNQFLLWNPEQCVWKYHALKLKSILQAEARSSE